MEVWVIMRSHGAPHCLIKYPSHYKYEIWAHISQPSFSVFYIVAGWIAEMIFMLFFALIAG